MKRVRLTHIDGKLPNLALMKLAHWHRAEGDHVTLTHTPQPSLFESGYDLVYGSAIFDWSEPEGPAARPEPTPAPSWAGPEPRSTRPSRRGSS